MTSKQSHKSDHVQELNEILSIDKNKIIDV